MRKDVVLGKLSLTMDTAVVAKWYKKEGENVQKGEPLCAVETDKATQDVEAFSSGVLMKILVGEGEEVTVPAVLAYIGDPADAAAEPPDPRHAPLGLEEPAGPVQSGGENRVDARRAGIRNATPLAKKIARDRGVDLAVIEGTGPGHIIVKKDVLAASDRVAVRSGGGGEDPRLERVPVHSRGRLASIKRITADRLSKSWDAPHFHLELTVDMGRIHEARTRTDHAGVTLTDFLLYATARALRAHLAMNSTFAGGELVIFEDINVGFAAATETGLVVPVIPRADTLSLQGLSSARKMLVKKALSGALGPDDLAGGTFTVTNLGMYGIESFTPVLNLGQSGILAAGKVMTVPKVDERGTITVGPVMRLCLACDHRVIDGVEGASFLTRLKDLMEHFDG